MLVIRIENDNTVIVFDEETAIDSNDCVEIEKAFNTLTIQECLNLYKKVIDK